MNSSFERVVNAIITAVMIAGTIYFLGHVLIALLDGRFEVVL